MSEYLDFLTFSGGPEMKCWGISMNFVGNKAKVRISKRVLQENKARQISRKTNISYPLIRTCVTGFRNFSFLEDFAKILEDYTKWITPQKISYSKILFWLGLKVEHLGKTLKEMQPHLRLMVTLFNFFF